MSLLKDFLVLLLANLLHYFLLVFRAITKYLYIWYFDHLRGNKLPRIHEPILQMSGTEIALQIRSRKIKCVEVVLAFIKRIEETRILNAIVADNFNKALDEAKFIDILFEQYDTIPVEYSFERKPLLGVPFTAKEAFKIQGMSNSSGLLSRQKYKSEYTADVINCLQQAGAIPLALTNCSELCMWFESSNLVYGRTCNPYHQGRIVGGSSGGEGCIISAAGSVIGVGSDIGGSIRMPAFFNGIFGHKPTTGHVSNKGQHPAAHGEQAHFLSTGPMCRYASDLLPMLKVMTGDNGNKLKLNEVVNMNSLNCYYLDCSDKRYLCSPVDSDIDVCISAAVAHFSNQGLHVEKIKLDKMSQSFSLWSLLMNDSKNTFTDMMADGKSISLFNELLCWLIQKPNHTFPAIFLGILECIPVDSDLRKEAVQICSDIKEELSKILGENGFLICPTHPLISYYHNEPVLNFLNAGYTGIINVLGLPATHIPMGLSRENAPLGFQVISNFHMDRIGIAVASELEKCFGGWVMP